MKCRNVFEHRWKCVLGMSNLGNPKIYKCDKCNLEIGEQERFHLIINNMYIPFSPEDEQDVERIHNTVGHKIKLRNIYC